MHPPCPFLSESINDHIPWKDLHLQLLSPEVSDETGALLVYSCLITYKSFSHRPTSTEHAELLGMWTRVNPECMFLKNFRGKLFGNGKRYAKSETTIQKALEERNPNHILHVQFERKTSEALANQICWICCTHNMCIITQNDRKRVKMSTSKWHRKQRHFFIHPVRSLQCIWFVGRKCFVENKLTRA